MGQPGSFFSTQARVGRKVEGKPKEEIVLVITGGRIKVEYGLSIISSQK